MTKKMSTPTNAAGNEGNARVECQNGEDGDGAQSLDIGTVVIAPAQRETGIPSGFRLRVNLRGEIFSTPLESVSRSVMDLSTGVTARA